MTAHVVGVLGASGGVGTTTVAAHLAWRAAQPETVLVGVSPHACAAIDVHVGVEHLPGPRWSAFERLRGEADGSAVAAVLPRTSRYAVLAGDGPAPPDAVVGSVLRGLREHADLLVLDLGSGLPSVCPALAVCDVLVVVTGLGVRHLADLDQVARDLHRLAVTTRPSHEGGVVPGAQLLLVTRGSRRMADLPEEIARHVDIPLVGHWPDDPRVAADLEHGIPPGERSRGLDPIADRILRDHRVSSTARVPA